MLESCVSAVSIHLCFAVCWVCLVRWRCVPFSCRCAHFRELFCTALCCNVLSATAVMLGAHVCAVQSPGPRLGDVQSWERWDSTGALAETGEGINPFKGLGYPNRLHENLSSTETLNLLTWGRRYQDCVLLYCLTLDYDCLKSMCYLV